MNQPYNRETGMGLCQVEEPPSAQAELDHESSWLATNSFLTLSGALVGRALQGGSQIVLARLLGPATFGLYTIGWALLRVGNTIAPLGLNNGVIHYATRYATTDQRRLGRVLGQSLGLAIVFGGLVAVMMCVGAPALANRVFKQDGLAPLICLFAAGVPLAAGLRVASASTQVAQTMRYSIYSETLMQPTANLALIFLFYVLGWRLFGAGTAAVASFGAGLVLAVYYERRLFPHVRFWGGPRAGPVSRELVQFSLMAGLGITFANLVPLVDRLFVGAYLTPMQVGIYQAASQTSVMLAVLAGTFNSITGPRISFLYQHSLTERLEQVYKVTTKWVVYASLPFLLVACSAPGSVLEAIYGPSYRSGARPLIILSIMWLLEALAGPASIVLIYTARQKIYSVIAVGEFVLCIALNYLLVPHFGAVGAALATGLATAAMMLAFLFGVRCTAGIWPFDWRWGKGIVAALATMGCLVLAGHLDVRPAILDVLFRLILSPAIFVGGLLILGLDPEDQEMIRTLRNHFVSITGGDSGDRTRFPR